MIKRLLRIGLVILLSAVSCHADIVDFFIKDVRKAMVELREESTCTAVTRVPQTNDDLKELVLCDLLVQDALTQYFFGQYNTQKVFFPVDLFLCSEHRAGEERRVRIASFEQSKRIAEDLYSSEKCGCRLYTKERISKMFGRIYSYWFIDDDIMLFLRGELTLKQTLFMILLYRVRNAFEEKRDSSRAYSLGWDEVDSGLKELLRRGEELDIEELQEIFESFPPALQAHVKELNRMELDLQVEKFLKGLYYNPGRTSSVLFILSLPAIWFGEYLGYFSGVSFMGGLYKIFVFSVVEALWKYVDSNAYKYFCGREEKRTVIPEGLADLVIEGERKEIYEQEEVVV